MSNLTSNHKNKRILQIIPNMEIGGAERTVLEITSFLKKNTNHTSIVLTCGGKLIKDLKRLKIDIIQFPIDKKNPFLILRNIFKLKKIFEKEKIDLIHVRSRGPAWSAIYAAKYLNIPILTTWHGHVNQTSWFKKKYNSIMHRGDALIANSKYTAENISKIYDIDKSKIDIIPRGVDINNFKESNFTSREVKKIKLIGRVENMPLAYQAADLILSPSIEPEPFGRIPIEAQASGKTIIACNAGAVKDTIKSGEDYTGFKAIPNDSESLADKIKIALNMENREIQDMQKRSILNVKNNFSLESMCKKTLEVYNRLLISK